MLASGYGTNSKNLPGVILVVGDAAVAHPALGHNGIESGVRDRESTAAAWRLLAVDECVHGSVSSMLVFNFLVATTSEEVKESADDTSNCHNADNNTSSNASRVRTTTARVRLGYNNHASCKRVSVWDRTHLARPDEPVTVTALVGDAVELALSPLSYWTDSEMPVL